MLLCGAQPEGVPAASDFPVVPFWTMTAHDCCPASLLKKKESVNSPITIQENEWGGGG
jgi:hypothetical protein